MICYRDMTFCPFYEDCKNSGDCHRPLTEEVKASAESIGLPVARFVEPPDCHTEQGQEGRDE